MGLFSKNKLTLKLEKFAFAPGETIKGSFIIDLKKTYYIRKIQVSLIGRRKEEYVHPKNGVSYNYYNVFDFDLPLAPEGDYQYQQFHFEIKIPSNILQHSETPVGFDPDSTLGKIQQFGRAFTNAKLFPIEWLVQAHIDIPKNFDLKKKQEIIISE